MNLNETKMHVLLILDIVGKPAGYLKETLEKMIGSMKEEKNISVLSSDIKEPMEMEDKKDFYTTFAEIELEAKGFSQLAFVMFKYMPAHVEIISPEKFSLNNNSLNEFVNELMRKLHGYDEVARIMQIENKKLKARLEELEKKKD